MRYKVHFFYVEFFSTDRPTDRQTDGPTDRQTDRQTFGIIEAPVPELKNLTSTRKGTELLVRAYNI